MILLIGYGNETRGDDGLGPFVARRLAEGLAEAAIPGVRVWIDHQLLPEMAPAVAESEMTIFIDAAASSFPVQIRSIQPGTGSFGIHAGTPEGLLFLTRQAFEKSPPAYLVAVGGMVFDYSLGLSEAAQINAEEAIRCISAWLSKTCEPDASKTRDSMEAAAAARKGEIHA